VALSTQCSEQETGRKRRYSWTGALVGPVLHGRKTAEYDIVRLDGQLVLDGAVFSAPEHVLAQQLLQFGLVLLSLYEMQIGRLVKHNLLW